MAATTEPFIAVLPGGRRVDVHVGGHVIHTDQPRDNGGEDTAPSPYDLFLASIAACAGIFVQGFCAKRGLSTEGMRVLLRTEQASDGSLRAVRTQLEVPADFPAKYSEALVRVVEQCSVKRAIAAQPQFMVSMARAGEGASAIG